MPVLVLHEPGGFAAISRWLSEATPPDKTPKKHASRRDACQYQQDREKARQGILPRGLVTLLECLQDVGISERHALCFDESLPGPGRAWNRSPQFQRRRGKVVKTDFAFTTSE
jgi:hypothetical protein